jgi:hypothetical protein
MSSASRSEFDDALRIFWPRATAFFVGLILLVAALGRLDLYHDVDVVGPKLAWFARHRANYDTLFLGSSLTHRGLSPAAYDSELRARGRPSRTFNFGALGMVPPESHFFLEQALALRPQHLRHVFLEVGGFQLGAKRKHMRRFDYWHSPRYTARVVRAIWASQWNWRWKLEQTKHHLEAALRKLFLVGQGQALSVAWRGPDIDREALGPDRDGWLSPEDDASNRMVQLRAEAAGLDEEERARRLSLPRGASRLPPDAALTALGDAVARIRAAGAKPILLALPRNTERDELLELVRARIDAPLLDFNDPERYPALFAPENRFDTNHMNRQGAALLSRLLAESLIELGGS